MFTTNPTQLVIHHWVRLIMYLWSYTNNVHNLLKLKYTIQSKSL
jgi:hypothetical protein